ncbi:hypothetical protein CGLO_17643 [Colletotrichum gloeosporioides Cg-14]|uniref:Uncharacterized protein n=1 Tax=Colletotrichum gloeosporioides (strain Cg-14) TaxID=1237896 RepID=T0L5W6_COLGC|nr:hypothetical protein CGLO_17643 [Colletotrichum gloeosporioides Cg-14]
MRIAPFTSSHMAAQFYLFSF